MAPLVSIIIPTRDEERNISRCLKAVFSQKVDFDYEVLVIDSGSKDQTRKLVRDFAQNHSNLHLIECAPESFSHGRTRALASEYAQGEFLVYLVADALPRDENWLTNLVKPALEDEQVAGTYSRQLPRAGAKPIEEIRLKKRKVFQTQPSQSQIKEIKDYYKLSPLEKIWLCDFDDVSSLRRRRVLEEIPIPDVDWAEDLLWSKTCLKKGYKIVFCPDSVVEHSHHLTFRYLFRRGWLDQKTAGENFGLIYYPNFKEMLKGYFKEMLWLERELISFPSVFTSKALEMLRAPFLLAGEVLGRFFAFRRMKFSRGISLLAHLSRAKIYPRDARQRVFKTGFWLGEDWREVIFAHPPAMVSFELKLPSQPIFQFALGIKPEAIEKRTRGIDFIVAVNSEPVFHHHLKADDFFSGSWEEFELDLKKWKEKKVLLSLITASSQLEYAWVGWAEPRIISPEKTIKETLKENFWTLLEYFAQPHPLRHP